MALEWLGPNKKRWFEGCKTEKEPALEKTKRPFRDVIGGKKKTGVGGG